MSEPSDTTTPQRRSRFSWVPLNTFLLGANIAVGLLYLYDRPRPAPVAKDVRLDPELVAPIAHTAAELGWRAHESGKSLEWLHEAMDDLEVSVGLNP